VEERIPRELLSSDDVPTRADSDEPAATADASGRGARSLLAVFLLALLAAAAGGLFVLKCQSNQPAQEQRANIP